MSDTGLSASLLKLCREGDLVSALDYLKGRGSKEITLQEIDFVLTSAVKTGSWGVVMESVSMIASGRAGSPDAPWLLRHAEQARSMGFGEAALVLLGLLPEEESARFGVLEQTLRIHRALKNSDQAALAAQRLVDRFPLSEKAWRAAAAFHRGERDFIAEEAALIESLKLRLKDMPTVARLAEIAAARSDHRASLARWRQVLRSDPRNVQAGLGVLRQLVRLKNFQSARDFLALSPPLPEDPEVERLIEIVETSLPTAPAVEGDHD